MIRNTGWECSLGLMEGAMTGSGRMESKMERVFIREVKAIKELEFGKKEED
jgi:hypothetical protein